jgi:hypothetical protein
MTNPEANSMIDAALEYLGLGFSVLPINPQNKNPFIKWKEFESRIAAEDEIREWWRKWPNAMLGIVTGTISGVVVVDIDEPKGAEELSKIIPDSLLIPTVKTPRGGQHLYFKSPTPAIGNNTRIVPGCDFRGEGGYIIAPPSMNGEGNAYEWVQGLSFAEASPPPLPELYINKIKEYARGGVKEGGYIGNVTDSVTLFTQGRRDNDLFHVANALAKSGTPQAEIYQTLEILAKNCNPPFPESEIKAKVESALTRQSKREINLADEVRAWVSVTDGDFSVTDCYKTIQTVTSVTKRDNIRQIIHRLRDEGFVEKVGTKDGIYRRVENQCDEIDFINAPDATLAIAYPFEIERLVKTLPKNIIVVAGEPNAGKTAFLLNFVKLNMARHKVYYFSSEMEGSEFKIRLNKFDIPLKEWKFFPRVRSSNFADVIKPNDINIIDFLEMSEDFFRVGGMIKQIFDRLKDGIAVIAIQKNPRTDYGLGGMRSLEKARLYCAIEPGKIKIVKAKNWAGTENPNGLQMDFKLAQGCKFIPQGNWKKENGQN